MDVLKDKRFLLLRKDEQDFIKYIVWRYNYGRWERNARLIGYVVVYVILLIFYGFPQLYSYILNITMLNICSYLAISFYFESKARLKQEEEGIVKMFHTLVHFPRRKPTFPRYNVH